MLSKNTVKFSILLILADFVSLVVAFGLAYIVRVMFDDRALLSARDDQLYFYAAMSIIPIWLIILAMFGVYHSQVYSRRLVEWTKLLGAAFVGTLLIISWEYVTNASIIPARLVVAYVFVGSFLLLVIEREILRLMRGLLFRLGKNISNVLIIGNSEATYDIAANLANTQKSGFRIVAVAGPSHTVPGNLGITRFKTAEQALEAIDELRVSTIIQTDLYDSAERNQTILSAAMSRHLNYNFIPGEPEFYAGKNTVDVFLGYPMISVSQTPLIGWGSIAKRIFDVIVASLLLILLSPIFMLLIILQQLFNPGPVFFRHQRLTQYSTPFMMYKFRSMIHKYSGANAAEIFKQMGRDDLVAEYKQHYKVKNDPRVTAFGKFMRKSSLDELPQLFNVIKGDLSLVGPRAIPKYELDEKFTTRRGALLLSVKSGITGLWQVSGRDNLTTEQRIQLELWYVQNWSFWLDIKILFKTIVVVLKRTGAD